MLTLSWASREDSGGDGTVEKETFNTTPGAYRETTILAQPQGYTCGTRWGCIQRFLAWAGCVLGSPRYAHTVVHLGQWQNLDYNAARGWELWWEVGDVEWQTLSELMGQGVCVAEHGREP